MSIVRQLVQICAVQALRDRTLADAYVYDSAITAIDVLSGQGERPVIVVSIEESEQSQKYDHGLFNRSTEIKMFVQWGVAFPGSYEDDAGNVSNFIEFGTTDAALEAKLNVMDRQWRGALTDPASIWGDHFKTLAPLIIRVKDTRMTNPESGMKYAARMAEVTIQVINEPDFGAALPADIQQILAAVGEIPDYADLAEIWTKFFSKNAGLQDPDNMQSDSYLSAASMTGLGLAKLDAVGDPFAAATIEVEGPEPSEVEVVV